MTPLTRQISLLEDYQQFTGLVDYNDINNVEKTIFSVSGCYEGNDHMRFGIREWLYRQFTDYDLGALFNISITEWMRQEYGVITLQIDVAKRKAKREADALKTLNDKPKDFGET